MPYPAHIIINVLIACPFVGDPRHVITWVYSLAWPARLLESQNHYRGARVIGIVNDYWAGRLKCCEMISNLSPRPAIDHVGSISSHMQLMVERN